MKIEAKDMENVCSCMHRPIRHFPEGQPTQLLNEEEQDALPDDALVELVGTIYFSAKGVKYNRYFSTGRFEKGELAAQKAKHEKALLALEDTLRTNGLEGITDLDLYL